MSKKELLEKIQKQVNELAQRRRAMRHADGLLYACGIQAHGRELVCWLGHAGLGSNRDALVFWALHQINEPGWNNDGMEIGILLTRLKECLNEINE